MALTSEFAEALVDLAHKELPREVQREASRSLLNVIGAAIRASRTDCCSALLRAWSEAASDPSSQSARVLGRAGGAPDRVAALVNAANAHYDDFDDTHLQTVIHPGATSMAAALSIGELTRSDGPAVLRAFSLGIEAQLRVGIAMSPSHYEGGWHITGTCGPIGAAAAGAVLLGLSGNGLERALGLAATASVGHRESFGSMLKPVQVGLAAAHGVESARLAEAGAGSTSELLDGPGGYFDALAENFRPGDVLDGIGTTWHLLDNTYKPYPCGIVTHPALDAAIALAHACNRGAEEILSIDVDCHPLVIELTGNPAPATGLEGRFSTAHGVAAALLRGRAGPAEYTDESVGDPAVAALRDRVTLTPNHARARDSAAITLTYQGGKRTRHEVTHARGSLLRPLTDDELAEKFMDGAFPVLGNRAEQLLQAILDMGEGGSLTRVLALATPSI